MKESLGIVVFYTLCVFGVILGAIGFLNTDIIFMVIGAAFIISAFLIKSEFKLHIAFWKEAE
ncbi:hypothetical protein [Acinetobacter radioresistens]|uniref:hypothetical protein n=1 Tax=Acinetobacter radioresistens TaxID=40216 RepID=UPI000E71D227|nr:hypothetical protein [Acinetobacter radioresistens]RJL73029.1 hypothetical protein D5055_06650 [Acinetobacter radioresistens]